MFENLTDKLERSFKILKGEGRISEINIAETLKEIRRALIDADVNYKVAKSFTDEVKQKALGQNVLKAVKPGQMMTKIVRDELAQLMGGTATDIRLEGTPAVILIAGLQGSGKTTFSGIVDRKGLQFGSPPVAHVKLRSVAHAQFVVECLRYGGLLLPAGIDERLGRGGPGRDGKQQEKKFLHCMTVRFSCKHNYFSRHNKISTADCAL